MAKRKLPNVRGEKLSVKRERKRGTQRKIPRRLRRAGHMMSGTLGTALFDLLHFCINHDIDIAILNRDVIDRAACLIRATGLKSADQRISAWRRAVDALPAECKAEYSVTETMTLPRGKRILSEPAGTFKLLEADLANAIDQAARPPIDIADRHKPVARKTAEAAGKRIMIVAATLHRADAVGTDVRLIDLLDPETQQKFLEAAYARIDPASIEHDTTGKTVEEGN